MKRAPEERRLVTKTPFDFVDSPNRYGLTPFYALHAWIWKSNPSGLLYAWNPNVSCDGLADLRREEDEQMRRFFTIVGHVGSLAAVAVSRVQAKGVSPAQLQRAGWSCVNPAGAFPANPNVHCFPPGQLEGVTAGTAATALLLTFAISDVNAKEAPLLGTERMIRADLFYNQPARPTRRAGLPARSGPLNRIRSSRAP